jgi:hypothetical protein
MDDTDLRAGTPIRRGMTVVRRGDRRQVRGVVLSCFPGWSDRRMRCRVQWEGATNGARRIGGGAWGSATCVLAERLEPAP